MKNSLPPGLGSLIVDFAIFRTAFFTILLAGFALLLCCSSGCVTTGTTTAESRPTRHPVEEAPEEEDPQIRVGMTKAQVRRAWGEPSGKEVSSRGEIWVYGNQGALRIIPYAGPWLNVSTAKVVFGSDGRVREFRNTDEGNIFSGGEGRFGSGFSFP